MKAIPEAARTAITITELDRDRLENVVDAYLEHDEPSAVALDDELGRAEVVPSSRISAAVMTMHSRASVRDERGRTLEATLVFPWQADASKGCISVLAPMGVALLGARTGDRIHVRTGRALRTWHIEAIHFQPEAAGRFDL